MGKRKRALSPKESVIEQVLSSANILKLKSGIEVKKLEFSSGDITIQSGKTETLDKTTLPSLDNEVSTEDRPTPQLRISARVQNKQKREESKYDLQSLTNSSKKIDGSSQDEDEEDEKGKSGVGGEGEREPPHNGITKKRRRAWELWSLEDKNTFFEAINESGKDFEAIQNYLLTKLRKKGIPSCMIKNKDQVRHFYYRTWHKISKHIEFSDDVKKSTQELYTLINYGELRRKVGGTLDEKKGQKLQELIQKGSTSVRIKGKSIRVRTPICRALKKLNEFPDDRDHSSVRVPVSISVEMSPASTSAWTRVQSLSHNPRVRVSCSMHKTVSSIIEHLQAKWRCTKYKICDSLVAATNFTLEVPPLPPTCIRLKPPTVTDFNIVNIKPDTQVKSYAVSLLSHSQMLQRKGETDTQNAKRKGCKPSRKKKVSTSSTGEGNKEKMAYEIETKEGSLKEKEDDEEKPTGGDISQEEEGSDVDVEVEVDEEQEIFPTILTLDSSHSSDETSLPPPPPPNPPQSPPPPPPPPNQDDDDDILILSSHPPNPNLLSKDKIPPKPPPPLASQTSIPYIVIKEETPLELPPNYEEEVFNAVKNIKEEVPDHMDTIHQLMALENVANLQEVEEDADVICIGESTKLSAHIHGSSKKKSEEQLSSSELELAKTQEQEEGQSKGPPEMDVGAESTSIGGHTYSTFAECVERAKQGWTAKSCGIITVGELYLMFGKNQRVALEYEFEDVETSEELSPLDITSANTNPKRESDNTVQTKNQCETASTKSTTEGTVPESNEIDATSTPSCFSSPPTTAASQFTFYVPESSNLGSPVSGSCGKSTEEEEVSTNPPPNSEMKEESTSDQNKAKKKVAQDISSMMAKLLYMIKIINAKGATNEVCLCGHGGMTGTPSKNALSHLRSPSNARCLNGFLKSPGNTKSPRGCSIPMRSPRTPTATMSPSESQGGPGQKVEKTKPASAKRLLAESAEKSGITSIASDSQPPTASKEKVGDPPTADKLSTVSGVKPFESTTSTGEFRVPIAPAPRNHGCHTPNPSFNAQLSKLLPRYSRPSRRSVRKNMVVQRQLPLLPYLPKTSQGFVTLRVGNMQEFNIVASTSPLTLPLDVANVAPNLPPTNNEVKLPPTTESLQQTASMPVVSESFANEKDLPPFTSSSGTDLNAISVNVSGHQLLTVKMPSYPISTASTTITSSTLSSITYTTSVSSASSCIPTTTTCALPSKGDYLQNLKQADTNSNYTLNTMFPPNLSDIIYLNTPPGTPLCSNTNSHLDSLLNLPSPSPSPSKNDLNSFIGTSTSNLLSISDMEMSTPLKSSLIPPPVSFSESSLLSTPTHLSSAGHRLTDSTISPIKLNLSSFLSSASSRSPDKSSLDILLHNAASDPGSTSNHVGHIPQIHIPECSADTLPILDISIGGTISVQEQTPGMIEALPVGSQLPVSDSGMLASNLPLSTNLAVSVSGMLASNLAVSTSGMLASNLAVSASGILASNLPLSPESSTGLSLSVTCLTTPTTSKETTSIKSVMDESLLYPFQESNDKMMDITLANSNSNSSFSSLLAAAANQPCLDSIMENSLLQTPPRPLLLSSGGGGAATLPTKSNLSFDSTGFDNLSTIPLSPPSSPSRLLRLTEGGAHWMHNEANEFSLSSLLGSIESPLKGAPPPLSLSSLSSSSSSQQTMASTMHSLISTLNDNSVDFTATFARLKQTKEGKMD